MGGSNNNKYVFIKDKEYAWHPCTLVKMGEKKATVSVPQYPTEQSILCDGGKGAKRKKEKQVSLKDYPNHVLPMQNVDGKGKALEFSDMVQLPFLHEPAILYNLKARHINGKPYTRTGDIIVAINPFQWFHDLYTQKKRTFYSNKLVWEKTESDPRRHLEPHVYETSSLCFKGLAFELQDQSILVSGESGAGKTETVKICMNHIASIQRGPVASSSSSSSSSKSNEEFLDPVVNRVLMSNPLLEAFGNAKTLRNDNSSRFGKYTQLQFENTAAKQLAAADMLDDRTQSHCTLVGSKCEVYLLEKNRIIGHEEGARNYHIFYQLIASEKSKQFWNEGLAGCTLESFKYVGRTNEDDEDIKIEGKSDAEHFDNVLDRLKLINVADNKLFSMMRAICAVMQCGNLTFGVKAEDEDHSECTSPEEIQKLSDLVGVCVKELTLCFTERTVKTRNETYKVPLNPSVSKESCDSFAKEIYGKVFLWLVKQINAATCAEENYGKKNCGIIGLLDIFGFESFETNRFEQLCINYANEKLQQKFTEDVFQAVQEEYKSEGIDLAEISYDDNTDVLNLIEGRTGLLALLNEECVRPKGTAEGFVNKALRMNKGSPCLFENLLDNRLSFGIHHYAGKVFYTCDDFVTRNQDMLPTDLKDCMVNSTNFIIAADTDNKDAAAKENTSSYYGSKNSRQQPKRHMSNIVAVTVWTKYRSQLMKLMLDLHKTKSKYIRCIKPNMLKKPSIMEHKTTVEQLRCAGVIAAITLSRSTFPNRLENTVVRNRYATMWDKQKFPSSSKKEEQQQQDDDNDSKRCQKDCIALLSCLLQAKEETDPSGNVRRAFVVGRTRTYFRAGALEFLETDRASIMAKVAVRIQSFVRGCLGRKKFGNLKRKREEEERRRREEEEERQRQEREKQEQREREKKERERIAQEKKRQEKEKKERLKREKKERLEKLKKEKEEKKLREKEESKTREEVEQLKTHVDGLQKELESAKSKAEREVQEAVREAEEEEEKTKQLKMKLASLMNNLNSATITNNPEKDLKAIKEKSSQADKVIKYLKKENIRLRTETDELEDDLKKMKDTNHKLIEANASAGASLESLTKQAQMLEAQNSKLESSIEKFQKDNQHLEKDLENRQAYVDAENTIRNDYEQAMEKIVHLMEEQCSDSELVEKVMTAQLKCVSNIAKHDL